MFQPQSFNRIKKNKALSRVTVTRLSSDICWFTAIVTGQLCQYYFTAPECIDLKDFAKYIKTIPLISLEILSMSCAQIWELCDCSASNFGLNLWLPQITQSKTHVITTWLAVVVWLAACHNTHHTAFKQDSTSLHLQN